ncbi:MAG: hypothetical protein IT292_11275 [Deltaproteobacteria bacterium]|nr:hypothetical protein [Deltaproteobacteria bacterium]
MYRRIFTLTLVGLLFIAPLVASASDYIRVVKDKAGDFEALKTLVQRFSGQYRQKTIQIDLIAAIHVAEEDYYADLNNRFRSYDAVLYELVAFPDQLSKHPVAEDKSMISSMQLSIVDLLGFKFQLESVNYHASNFVHADYSPTELVTAMRTRNESFTQIMLRLIGASMEEGNSPPQQQQNWRMLMELMRAPSPARTIRLRRMFADQLAGSDKILETLNGNQGSALIHGRNERVMQVLEKELKRGRRRIAIFYGAGHMTDMEEALMRKLDVRPAGEEWLRAWNLRMPQP